MSVRKAVITAAGWGTRFLPATKAQPKETLPIIDTPMIQYVVEEAVASGIQQIIIVTSLGKRAIEDYFDRTLELEAFLERRGDLERLERIRSLSDLADVCYVRQKEQRGLGHAILSAKAVVGDEPFAVLLPDDIIETPVPALKQLLEVYTRYRCSVVAVEQVPLEQISAYGVIEPKQITPGIYQVLHMVEKPPANQAPSSLGIVGRYVLTPQIFEMLENANPGALGEIQLTDGLDLLLQRQAIYACEFKGTRYDAGTPLGLLKTSVTMALKRSDLGPEFASFLERVVAEYREGAGREGRRKTVGHARRDGSTAGFSKGLKRPPAGSPLSR
jgi:UTP--glucose-1-phosphate uridylyltransferase